MGFPGVLVLPLGKLGVKISENDRRRGVHAGRDSAHTGREKGGYDKARQARREPVDDEIREHLVPGEALRKQPRLGRIVGIQGRSDVNEEKRDRNVEEPAEKRRAHRITGGTGGHITLHIVLVDPVVLEIHEYAIYEHYPHRGLPERQGEASETEFPVRSGYPEKLTRSLGHPECEDKGAGERSRDQDYPLDGIGPNDGGDSSENGIYKRKSPGQDDDRADVPAEHRVERNREKQQYGSNSADLGQEVADRHVAPGPPAVAVLKEPVC